MPKSPAPRDGLANLDIESGQLARDRCAHAEVVEILTSELEPGLQLIASISQLLQLLLLHAGVGSLTLERYFAAILVVGQLVLEGIDSRVRYEILRDQLALPIYFARQARDLVVDFALMRFVSAILALFLVAAQRLWQQR